MPLYPSKSSITVEADSVSPVENLLTRLIFPQKGDEPEVPVNPVGAIAKGAFFKKLRQSLREMAIEQRVRRTMSVGEANSLYAEGLKSLEKLKTLPQSVFRNIYGVSGSTKRAVERAKTIESNEFSKMKWLQEHGASEKTKLNSAEKWATAMDNRNFLADEKNYGYLLGTKGTRSLTGVSRVKGRSLLGVTNEPGHNFGETVGHEIGHSTSLTNTFSAGKALSEDLPQLADPSQLRGASKATGVDVHDNEELFAELFSYHSTGNNYMLDKLRKEGFGKQIDFVGNLHRSLVQKRQKAN